MRTVGNGRAVPLLDAQHGRALLMESGQTTRMVLLPASDHSLDFSIPVNTCMH